ncbi:hypothetical protein [Nostoc sp. PA-18-2419]|nr:hypothetical protein [Nostoc sp. PA-18-2419]
MFSSNTGSGKSGKHGGVGDGEEILPPSLPTLPTLPHLPPLPLTGTPVA